MKVTACAVPPPLELKAYIYNDISPIVRIVGLEC